VYPPKAQRRDSHYRTRPSKVSFGLLRTCHEQVSGMHNAPGRRDLGHRWTIGRTLPSRRSGLNRGPFDYESSALPLSYAGDCESDCKRLRNTRDALARTRTATPCGTTPSRWRVYQFHHQGNSVRRLAHSPATPWTSKPTSCTRTTLERRSYHAPTNGTDGARTRDLRCDRPAL
jgi:hypothetical protein